MDGSKEKGVSVVICTYNGEKLLPATLCYLARQKVNADLQWEILLINNASIDNSAKIAVEKWNSFGSVVPFTVLNERQKGKDFALKLGFAKAKFKYVIICDDDNWLCESYLQTAYNILESNPAIGLLGGKGVPVFDKKPPFWFEKCKTLYAVGKQYLVNGEVRHYWPNYRFIWGAGAIVNLEAYDFLERKGFKRVLNSVDYPHVARSEDVELGLAIWLGGYKLWFDERLTYHHYLPEDRLKWKNFMKVVKQSISSIHYLTPYNILIFTGLNNAPKESFWKDYILLYWREVRRNFRSFKDFKILLRILTNSHIEDLHYLEKAQLWYRFMSVLKLGKGYDRIFRRILKLQKEIYHKNT